MVRLETIVKTTDRWDSVIVIVPRTNERANIVDLHMLAGDAKGTSWTWAENWEW